MNNHQESTFHPLGNFLNPALVLLGQDLRKLSSGQKLNFANHLYLGHLQKPQCDLGRVRNSAFFSQK
ncbi:hypothetical protein THERMOT_593 [Bathymodiolus thermophilus thioautotrophic gill symbiont]|uniref:hypothetical protein n=1 Tax=Bathymodiolus thermophilus thioautotrophic gill symbiont TaxID=2360 RepID=UPI001160303C|nr:hypothetical protein [Bathymodiolus thermophilus thioautotrophic gill symbiont]CAB5496859.1 hypothetical protein THERMOT_593 [Bathymodiolus thermophilus thioautotrophic gill symbiont]